VTHASHESFTSFMKLGVQISLCGVRLNHYIGLEDMTWIRVCRRPKIHQPAFMFWQIEVVGLLMSPLDKAIHRLWLIFWNPVTRSGAKQEACTWFNSQFRCAIGHGNSFVLIFLMCLMYQSTRPWYWNTKNN